MFWAEAVGQRALHWLRHSKPQSTVSPTRRLEQRCASTKTTIFLVGEHLHVWTCCCSPLGRTTALPWFCSRDCVHVAHVFELVSIMLYQTAVRLRNIQSGERRCAACMSTMNLGESRSRPSSCLRLHRLMRTGGVYQHSLHKENTERNPFGP